VGLIKSTDDFEILDGLKQNAGKKKQMGGYAAIANLQVPQRFDHKNMCPVAMVNSKIVEKQKMLRVFAEQFKRGLIVHMSPPHQS